MAEETPQTVETPKEETTEAVEEVPQAAGGADEGIMLIAEGQEGEAPEAAAGADEGIMLIAEGQEGEEAPKEVEKPKTIQITKFEYEIIPNENIELVPEPKYFAKECKRLKNTESSVKRLLKNKKSANWWTKCDAEGNTLMHLALKNSWFSVFSELMKEHPAAIYTPNNEGATPITVFLQQEQTEAHKICFNVVSHYYNNLSKELKDEIIEFTNQEDNVYYKSVMGQD